MRTPCGSCVTCLTATNRLIAPPRSTSLLPGPAPTAAGLEKHARKYGPAQVAETAAEFGVSVAVEREKKQSTPRGPSLKTRVRQHVANGLGVELIAELEDLSPSRARRLVEEVS